MHTDKSSPKDALAMAKKLVEAGVWFIRNGGIIYTRDYIYYMHKLFGTFDDNQKLNIAKSTSKTTGFKRVGETSTKVHAYRP